VESVAERPVLAIDLGGTRIRTALIEPDRSVVARREEPTHDDDGVDAVLARIVELARATRDEASADGLAAPVGVGISSPGPLGPARGVVIAPPNLRIVPAALGRDVSLIGALSIVQERIGDPRYDAGLPGPQMAAAQQGAPRP
jgi:hypothetical protein